MLKFLVAAIQTPKYVYCKLLKNSLGAFEDCFRYSWILLAAKISQAVPLPSQAPFPGIYQPRVGNPTTRPLLGHLDYYLSCCSVCWFGTEPKRQKLLTQRKKYRFTIWRVLPMLTQLNALSVIYFSRNYLKHLHISLTTGIQIISSSTGLGTIIICLVNAQFTESLLENTAQPI